MANAPQAPSRVLQTDRFASRNDAGAVSVSMAGWVESYLALAVAGVRSDEVSSKIDLHLGRFCAWFAAAYGHDRISAVGTRDVAAWQRELSVGLAPATVNSHLASLSGFVSWVDAQSPGLLAQGAATAAVAALALPPLEPRSLDAAQIRSLKSVCDRLERFCEHKGRHGRDRPVHAHSRPRRDRAIVYVLLSTGLRRAELVGVDIDQLQPRDPDGLRAARRARLVAVRGKGSMLRTVFLSADARSAVADYIEFERPGDADEHTVALFLSARSVAARQPGGRLSTRAVNSALARIGRLHDSEHADTSRHISPLRPNDLRHTFAFGLSEATSADGYELQRRLGHRSQRYIARYTNPPEDVAAGYIEDM